MTPSIPTPNLGASTAQPSAPSPFGARPATVQSTTPFGQQGFAIPTPANPSTSEPLGHPVATFQAKDDPYIRFLPTNYLEILPAQIRAAFEADEFDISGVGIPELPPPIELR